MSTPYDPATWYWSVQDSLPGTQVWSGASGSFVPLADAGYVAFLAAGNTATVIDTFVNLLGVIQAHNVGLMLTGAFYGVHTQSGATITLTNPMKLAQGLNSSTNKVILPPMNRFGSIPMGVPIYFGNGGVAADNFQLYYQDGVTLVDSVTIAGAGLGLVVAYEVSDNSTSNGSVYRVGAGPNATWPPLWGGTGSASVPSAGQVPVGNGSIYSPQTLSGGATLSSTGVLNLLLRGYLSGLSLSNDAGTPNTVIDVAAGVCMSDDVTTMMTLAAFTKNANSTWVVGTGNGSADGAASYTTLGASTWYHVFVIERTDTGVVDILTSKSATAPTLPTNYTKQRRIGSFKTNASSQIIKFKQDGDLFQWDATVADVNSVNGTNPGTAAVTRTLTTPLGVRCEALVQVGFSATTPATDNPAGILISDLSISDQAPSVGNATIVGYSQLNNFFAPARVMTNTSSQVRSRLQISTAGTVLSINTTGWVDTRGRFS